MRDGGTEGVAADSVGRGLGVVVSGIVDEAAAAVCESAGDGLAALTPEGSGDSAISGASVSVVTVAATAVAEGAATSTGLVTLGDGTGIACRSAIRSSRAVSGTAV